MNFFSYYKIALQTEWLKKKHTGTFLLCGLLGFIFPIVLFFYYLSSSSDWLTTSTKIPFNYYINQIGRTTLNPFVNFMLPLIIIITAIKLTYADHKNGGWILMETQPLSRLSIYLSKLTLLIIGTFIGILSYLSFSVFFAWALQNILGLPESAEGMIPWYFLFQITIRLLISGLFFSALMILISIIFKNFIVSITLGFLALIGTTILTGMGIFFPWNPLALISETGKFAKGSDVHHFLLYTEVISILGFAVLTALGFLYYKNKTFMRRFLKPKLGLTVLGILLIGGLLMKFIMHPKTIKPYSKTVISGTIESDQKVDRVYLINQFLKDTLSVIPVHDQTYHQVISQSIPLDSYGLVFEAPNQFATYVFMGDHDSIHLKIKNYAGETQIESVTGTRLVENKFIGKDHQLYRPGHAWYIVDQSEYYNQPEVVAHELHKSWKENKEDLKTFLTQDNYQPRADFSDRAKKLLSVKYMNLWHKFQDNSRYDNPKVVTEIPQKIQEIKKEINLQDYSLVSEQDYLDYVLHELTKNDNSDTDFLTKNMNALSKMENSNFKDQLLFATLKEDLEHTPDAAERQKVIAQYGPEIQTPRLKKAAQQYFSQLSKLGVGSPAPKFIAQNLKGDSVKLADLNGKIIVIDVWATWCGPCLHEAPYFERVALKNKANPNITFVALSVDEDKSAWETKARGNSSAVLQLHLDKKAVEKFAHDYLVKGIPRYISIDPEGNIIDAKMPFPSSNRFETQIQRLLEDQKS